MKILLIMRILLLHVMLVSGGGVLAADNVIGIYADSTGVDACTSETGPITCYVILSNVSDNVGVSGWQFRIRIDSGGSVFGPNYPVPVMSLQQFPSMQLGCGTPIPASEKMVLMTFEAWSRGTPKSIYIDRLSFDLPVLIILASTSQLRQVDYEYGGGSAPVFSMGGAVCPERNTGLGIVEATSASWGNVKALYR